MIVYVLALGSPTHAIGEDAWPKWTEPYRWGTFHGEEHLGFDWTDAHVAQWRDRQENALEWRIRRAMLPERWALEMFPMPSNPP